MLATARIVVLACTRSIANGRLVAALVVRVKYELYCNFVFRISKEQTKKSRKKKTFIIFHIKIVENSKFIFNQLNYKYYFKKNQLKFREIKLFCMKKVLKFLNFVAQTRESNRSTMKNIEIGNLFF
jgi:hypothetical protein